MASMAGKDRTGQDESSGTALLAVTGHTKGSETGLPSHNRTEKSSETASLDVTG